MKYGLLIMLILGNVCCAGQSVLSEFKFRISDSLLTQQMTDTGVVYLYRTPVASLAANEVVLVDLEDTERLSGTVVILYASGAKFFSSRFQKGIQDGPQFYWYENGHLMRSGEYNMGVKVGNHIHYYRSGLPNLVVAYGCNGDPLLSVVYDPNGRCTEAIPSPRR